MSVISIHEPGPATNGNGHHAARRRRVLLFDGHDRSIIGAAPARLVFGASAGSLQSEKGAGTVAARLKYMGFEGGEIISAKKT